MGHERDGKPPPWTLVAYARGRQDAVRPVPARLPPARWPAWSVFRAHARRRADAAHYLWTLVRLLRRSDREKTAEPVLSGIERALLRHRRLQARLQVLPELGYLQVARHGQPVRRGQPGGDRPGRATAGLQER